MVEPSGHCPYLGLKQNRAIRFASPTPEHRCYVGGEPIEIPVEQASYCLSPNHIHCPLYMGLSVPTTAETTAAPAGGMLIAPTPGVRGWFATLSPLDRALYAIMLAMLVLIVAIYLFAGLRTFFGPQDAIGQGGAPAGSTTTSRPVAVGATATSATISTSAPPAPTTIPPTPTALPTSTPSPLPTEAPTRQPVIIVPTQAPTTAPALNAPTATPRTSGVVASPTSQPAGVVASPTSQPAGVVASPTRAPTPRPTTAPARPPPTSTPQPSITTQVLTLYFADATGSLFVPVQRSARVENQQVARAAVRELIAGPRGGLGRLILPDVQLLDLQISGGTATVNFDRRPTGQGDERGFDAIVLTLTHFPSIQRVQLQVNGQNLGGPRGRSVLNPLNPQNLANNTRETEFLPLYFLSADGTHDVRIIRMVPKTKQTAEATVRALLEGPGAYSYALQRVIPEGAELRGIRLEQGVVTVDFTQPFANAANRAAAVRTVAESLTTLPGVSGVQFLVEGRSLAEQWGGEYGKVFGRVAINPE